MHYKLISKTTDSAHIIFTDIHRVLELIFVGTCFQELALCERATTEFPDCEYATTEFSDCEYATTEFPNLPSTSQLIVIKQYDFRKLATWKWLAEKGVDIYTSDAAIIWASGKGYLKIVKFLIENGANIHAQNNFAVIVASARGHLEVVKMLIECRADIHAGNDLTIYQSPPYDKYFELRDLTNMSSIDTIKNNDAVKFASCCGHLEVVKILIQYGANIHVDDDYAIQLALYNEHIEVVKLLIECRANVHANNDHVIKLASHIGNFDLAILLINNGGDIHNDNDCAIRIASYCGHVKVVKLLIEYGANIHAGRYVGTIGGDNQNAIIFSVI